jgi:hypothetical protein
MGDGRWGTATNLGVVVVVVGVRKREKVEGKEEGIRGGIRGRTQIAINVVDVYAPIP